VTHLFLSLQAQPFVTLHVALGSFGQSGFEEPVLPDGVAVSFGAGVSAEADGSGDTGASLGAADAGGGAAGSSVGETGGVWLLQWRQSTTNPRDSRCMR